MGACSRVGEGRVKKLREGLVDVLIDTRYLLSAETVYHKVQWTSCV